MALTGLLKPCYVFAPRTFVRRVAVNLRPPRDPVQVVRLPWGATLEVNAHEVIGLELVRQNVFDIAVSETAWRLLGAGELAVDVGANIGYMTSLFAARVGAAGRVEAFEPHPRIYARLRHNVSGFGLQSPPEFVLHECALGSRDGSAWLVEPAAFGHNEGTSTLAVAPGSTAGGAAGVEVRVARLDGLLGERAIALLKVDVEGFEAEVFAGAGRLLAAGQIRHIIYEAHDCERSALHALLAGYGYAIFGIGHDLLGLKVTPGIAAPRIDRRWESPSYLAALDPAGVSAKLRERGWQVLRAC